MNKARSILSARGLTARRSWRVVFSEVSLDIFPGDRIFLTGQNGAGKTTLLETLLGLYSESGGELFWKGESGSPHRHQAFNKQEVFYLPQHNNLFKSLTLRQNILIGSHIDTHSAKLILREALGVVPELKSSLDRRPAQASTGQRQIAAFLRLLMIRSPRLVVLDEPTAGISNILLRGLYELANQYIAPDSGMIFTDQHVDVARSLATHELVLERRLLHPSDNVLQTSGG